MTTNITVFNTGGISKDAKRSGIPMITTMYMYIILAVTLALLGADYHLSSCHMRNHTGCFEAPPLPPRGTCM